MKSISVALLAAATISTVNGKLTDAEYFYNTERPVNVGHRGSFAHFPEHSKGGYVDAFYLGADWVELDLQVTKDGHVISFHDPCLKNATNIESYEWKWGDRKSSYTFPSGNVFTHDYLVHDFTLAEIKTLREKQRMEYRNQELNDVFQIMTLEEVIELMFMLNTENPRDHAIGLYIENKEYDFYIDNYDINIAQMTFDILESYNIETIEKSTANGLPIIIQSFEKNALKMMETLTDLPLVQLMWKNVVYDFDDISTYAHGVGPDSQYIMYWPDLLKKELDATTRSPFIDQMHSLDLAVHPWTMRDDHLSYMDKPTEEIMLYIGKGVDGLFTEFPHTTL